MTMIEILDPAGQVQKVAALQCNPAEPLKGRRLAVLDNAKPNARLIASLAGERLREEFSLGEIRYFRKENPTVGASPELLDEIAESADLVLTGSAD